MHFSDERSDFIPDVPTIKEATGEDFCRIRSSRILLSEWCSTGYRRTTTDALLKAMEDPDYIENMKLLLVFSSTIPPVRTSKELLESQVETRKMITGTCSN